MKKILIVSTLESVPWGGSEELWYYTARQLLSEGHEVGISRIAWEPQPEKLQELVRLGALLFLRPNIHLPRAKTEVLFRVKNQIHKRTQFQALLNFKPNVIFINQGGAFDPYLEQLAPLLLKNAIPFIIICHHIAEQGYLPENRRQTFRDVFQKAMLVMFVSQRNKDVAERMLAGTIASARVIYHPPITIPRDVAVPYPAAEPYQLACVARLDTAYKGQDILLEVLSAEKWQHRNWKLNFYGNGPHRAYLEELVRYYRLEAYIVFKGHLNQISEVWRQNHMLVLPSLSEGTPLSLFEAACFARPALVTDVGGNGELVLEGETGFVAAPGITALAAGLERAWLCRAQWQTLGSNAQQRVRTILNQHQQAFDEVIHTLKN